MLSKTNSSNPIPKPSILLEPEQIKQKLQYSKTPRSTQIKTNLRERQSSTGARSPQQQQSKSKSHIPIYLNEENLKYLNSNNSQNSRTSNFSYQPSQQFNSNQRTPRNIIQENIDNVSKYAKTRQSKSPSYTSQPPLYKAISHNISRQNSKDITPNINNKKDSYTDNHKRYSEYQQKQQMTPQLSPKKYSQMSPRASSPLKLQQQQFFIKKNEDQDFIILKKKISNLEMDGQPSWNPSTNPHSLASANSPRNKSPSFQSNDFINSEEQSTFSPTKPKNSLSPTKKLSQQNNFLDYGKLSQQKRKEHQRVNEDKVPDTHQPKSNQQTYIGSLKHSLKKNLSSEQQQTLYQQQQPPKQKQSQYIPRQPSVQSKLRLRKDSFPGTQQSNQENEQLKTQCSEFYDNQTYELQKDLKKLIDFLTKLDIQPQDVNLITFFQNFKREFVDFQCDHEHKPQHYQEIQMQYQQNDNFQNFFTKLQNLPINNLLQVNRKLQLNLEYIIDKSQNLKALLQKLQQYKSDIQFLNDNRQKFHKEQENLLNQLHQYESQLIQKPQEHADLYNETKKYLEQDQRQQIISEIQNQIKELEKKLFQIETSSDKKIQQLEQKYFATHNSILKQFTEEELNFMEYFTEQVLTPQALQIYMNLCLFFDYDKILHIIQKNNLNFTLNSLDDAYENQHRPSQYYNPDINQIQFQENLITDIEQIQQYIIKELEIISSYEEEVHKYESDIQNGHFINQQDYDHKSSEIAKLKHYIEKKQKQLIQKKHQNINKVIEDLIKVSNNPEQQFSEFFNILHSLQRDQRLFILHDAVEDQFNIRQIKKIFLCHFQQSKLTFDKKYVSNFKTPATQNLIHLKNIQIQSYKDLIHNLTQNLKLLFNEQKLFKNQIQKTNHGQFSQDQEQKAVEQALASLLQIEQNMSLNAQKEREKLCNLEITEIEIQKEHTLIYSHLQDLLNSIYEKITDYPFYTDLDYLENALQQLYQIIEQYPEKNPDVVKQEQQQSNPESQEQKKSGSQFSYTSSVPSNDEQLHHKPYNQPLSQYNTVASKYIESETKSQRNNNKPVNVDLSYKKQNALAQKVNANDQNSYDCQSDFKTTEIRHPHSFQKKQSIPQNYIPEFQSAPIPETESRPQLNLQEKLNVIQEKNSLERSSVTNFNCSSNINFIETNSNNIQYYQEQKKNEPYIPKYSTQQQQNSSPFKNNNIKQTLENYTGLQPIDTVSKYSEQNNHLQTTPSQNVAFSFYNNNSHPQKPTPATKFETVNYEYSTDKKSIPTNLSPISDNKQKQYDKDYYKYSPTPQKDTQPNEENIKHSYNAMTQPQYPQPLPQTQTQIQQQPYQQQPKSSSYQKQQQQQPSDQDFISTEKKQFQQPDNNNTNLLNSTNPSPLKQRRLNLDNKNDQQDPSHTNIANQVLFGQDQINQCVDNLVRQIKKHNLVVLQGGTKCSMRILHEPNEKTDKDTLDKHYHHLNQIGFEDRIFRLNKLEQQLEVFMFEEQSRESDKSAQFQCQKQASIVVSHIVNVRKKGAQFCWCTDCYYTQKEGHQHDTYLICIDLQYDEEIQLAFQDRQQFVAVYEELVALKDNISQIQNNI